jgi:hypothetical protein
MNAEPKSDFLPQPKSQELGSEPEPQPSMPSLDSKSMMVTTGAQSFQPSTPSLDYQPLTPSLDFKSMMATTGVQSFQPSMPSLDFQPSMPSLTCQPSTPSLNFKAMTPRLTRQLTMPLGQLIRAGHKADKSPLRYYSAQLSCYPDRIEDTLCSQTDCSLGDPRSLSDSPDSDKWDRCVFSKRNDDSLEVLSDGFDCQSPSRGCVARFCFLLHFRGKHFGSFRSTYSDEFSSFRFICFLLNVYSWKKFNKILIYETFMHEVRKVNFLA